MPRMRFAETLADTPPEAPPVDDPNPLLPLDDAPVNTVVLLFFDTTAEAVGIRARSIHSRTFHHHRWHPIVKWTNALTGMPIYEGPVGWRPLTKEPG